MNKPPPGHIRIIAGHLRGSKLPVAVVPGLRPTSARARETLFNWLQNDIAGRNVLDAFAGSGALGFEAASRGATSVILLERDAALAKGLVETAQRLKVESVQVVHDDALIWLSRSPNKQFDLVFLDPPFATALWDRAVLALLPWLAASAMVYIELDRDAVFVAPTGWTLHRQGQGQNARHLLFRTANQSSTATLAGSS